MPSDNHISFSPAPDWLLGVKDGHEVRIPLQGEIDGMPPTEIAEVLRGTAAQVSAALARGIKIRPGTIVVDPATNLVLGTIGGDGVINAGGSASVTLIGAVNSSSTTAALRADQGPVLAGLISARYTKPGAGIPETDLDTSTQTKLNSVAAALAGKQDTLTSPAGVPGLTAALAAKQNVLTSPGDVPGLTSALAAKQDVLVSGTHIKTLNGQALVGSGNLVIPSALPTPATFSTNWTATTAQDFGTYTIVGATALVGAASGSVQGAFTQATIIANGTNIPTFNGVTSSGWKNAAGTKNVVKFFDYGGETYWSVNGAIVYVPEIGSAVETVSPAGASVNTADAAWSTTWGATSAAGIVMPAQTPGANLTLTSTAIGAVRDGYTTGAITPTAAITLTLDTQTAQLASGVTYVVTLFKLGTETVRWAISGQQAAAAVPTAPGAPTVSNATAITETGLTYTFANPASNGGSAITSRNADISFDGGATWAAITAPVVGANTITFASSTSARTAQIRARATNDIGSGAYGTLTGIAIPASAAPAGLIGIALRSLAYTDVVGALTESGDFTAGYTYTKTATGAYGTLYDFRKTGNATPAATERLIAKITQGATAGDWSIPLPGGSVDFSAGGGSVTVNNGTASVTLDSLSATAAATTWSRGADWAARATITAGIWSLRLVSGTVRLYGTTNSGTSWLEIAVFTSAAATAWNQYAAFSIFGTGATITVSYSAS